MADIPAVIAGEDADPVSTVQAAASRLAYSYGRDDMIMGSSLLKRFSPTRHVPPYALVLAALVPALIVVGSMFSTDAITKIISFAALGIYLGFQMVVLAALRARLRGWVPSGKYTLGAWGLPVNVAALAYGVIAMVNMAWPRTPEAPWYDNWIVALSAVLVVGLGLVYMTLHPLHDRSTAPYDDAIPKR